MAHSFAWNALWSILCLENLPGGGRLNDFCSIASKPDFDSPAHFKLLLFLVRVRLTPSEKQAACNLIKGQLDWKAFLVVAQSHRLGPLALRGLEETSPQGVPEFVYRKLRAFRMTNRLRVLTNTLEIHRIISYLAKNGYTLTFLKGSALAHTIYGDPCIRHSGDIDLLTDGKDLGVQILHMRELGYELVDDVCAAGLRRLRWYRRFWKDLSFRNEKSGFMVDLHWRLFNNRWHGANQLGSTLQICRGGIFGSGLQTLSKVDQFLYCAAHGNSDSWVYLKSLADMAAFLHVLSADEWTAALDKASHMGLLVQLRSAVLLAGELMGAPTPSCPRSVGDDRFHQEMRARVLHELERTDFTPRRRNPGVVGAMQIELWLTPGIRSMMEVAGRYLWRPRIWSVVDLPDKFIWLTPVFGLLLPPRRGET